MKTAMQELIEIYEYYHSFEEFNEWFMDMGKKAMLEKEKEQSLNLIKQTCMFMGASIIDIEISKMEFEDVYNSCFNQNK